MIPGISDITMTAEPVPARYTQRAAPSNSRLLAANPGTFFDSGTFFVAALLRRSQACHELARLGGITTDAKLRRGLAGAGRVGRKAARTTPARAALTPAVCSDSQSPTVTTR